MSIFTMNGFLKIFDVSRHDPKLIVPPKSGYDLFGNFGEIIMAKCNATGTHLAMTIATESLVPDGKLYIWEMEKDRLSNYDFLNKYKQPIENEKKNVKDAEQGPFVRRLEKRYSIKMYTIFNGYYLFWFQSASVFLLG